MHLVHLTPNVVLTLAIFAHLCEMLFGVWPSNKLFRHFFYRQCSSVVASSAPRMVGVCFFYIAMILHDKWED